MTAEDAAGNVEPASNEASGDGPAAAADRARRRLRLRRRDRHDRRRPVGQRQHGHALERDLGGDAGKFGNALSFNGTNAYVTVPDSNSLDLTTGMTLEALGAGRRRSADWRTCSLKERPGDLVYGLYANTRLRTGRSPQVISGGTARLLEGRPPLRSNTWTHLAATYDGTMLAPLRQRRRRSAQVAVAGAITDLDLARSRSAATRSGASSSTA